MSRRMVDFPAPLAPRNTLVCPVCSVKLTSFRITFSSNARCDAVEHDDRPAEAERLVEQRRPASAVVPSPSVHQHDEDLGHQVVNGNHRHRAGDDRVGGRAADPLGAAARPHPDVAADADDREARGRTA